MATSPSAEATTKSSEAEKLQSTSDASLTSRESHEYLLDSALASRSDGNQLYHEVARQVTEEVLQTSMAAIKQSIQYNGLPNSGDHGWLEDNPRRYVQTERLEIRRNTARKLRPVVSIDLVETIGSESVSVSLAQQTGAPFNSDEDAASYSAETGMFKVPGANRRELGIGLGTVDYRSTVSRDENENMLSGYGGVRRLESEPMEHVISKSTHAVEEAYQEAAKRVTDEVLRNSVKALEPPISYNGISEARSNDWLGASAVNHSRVYVQTDRLNSRITRPNAIDRKVNDRRASSFTVRPRKRVVIHVRPEDIAYQSTLTIYRDRLADRKVQLVSLKVTSLEDDVEHTVPLPRTSESDHVVDRGQKIPTGDEILHDRVHESHVLPSQEANERAQQDLLQNATSFNGTSATWYTEGKIEIPTLYDKHEVAPLATAKVKSTEEQEEAQGSSDYYKSTSELVYKSSPDDLTRQIAGLATSSSIQESDACGVQDDDEKEASERSERTALSVSVKMTSPERENPSLDFREDHFADIDLPASLTQTETHEEAGALDRPRAHDSSLVFELDTSKDAEILRDPKEQQRLKESQETGAKTKLPLIPQFEDHDSEELSRELGAEVLFQLPTHKPPTIAGHEIPKDPKLEASEDSGNEDGDSGAHQRQITLVSVKVTSMDDQDQSIKLQSREEDPFDKFEDEASKETDLWKIAGGPTHSPSVGDVQSPEKRMEDLEGFWSESDEEEGYDEGSEELLMARKESREAVVETREGKVPEVVVDIRNNRRADGTEGMTELAEEFADGAEITLVGVEYTDTFPENVEQSDKTTHTDTRIVRKPEEESVPIQEHTSCRDSALSLIALATRDVGPNELDRRKDKESQLFQEGSRRRPPATARSPEAVALSAKGQSIKASSELLRKDSRPVGAAGFVVVNDDVRIPPNDFFTPGRVFEARIKHSSFPASSDDRRVNFKTLSIKLSDHDVEAPLDLILQTGQISPFCNAETMDQFQSALRTGKAQNIRQAILTTPACAEAALDGLRILPESYYHQHYYSPIVYNFRSTDGRRYLARFRVIPKDGAKETGRLLPEQHGDIWTYLSQDYIPQTSKQSDYLRDEYKSRFQGTAGKRSPEYDIQIQLHEVSPADADKTNKWYNPFLIWNEPYHPWFSLATLTTADLLPGRSTKVTQFTLPRLPIKTLSITASSSVHDFNSVPEMLAIAATAADQGTDASAKTAAVSGISAKQAEYYLYCVTGDRMNAGTLSDIYVSIVGTTGRTAYQRLEPRYKTDFERAGKATFLILDRPVGYLRYMKFFKEKHATPSDWYLDYVILSTPYNNKSYTLPVYRWFTDEVSLLTVRDGPGVLLSSEIREDMRVQRTLEVSYRQTQLKWRIIHGQNPYSMLPGYLHNGELLSAIPADLQSDAVANLEMQWREHRAGKFSLFKTIVKFFTSRKATISVEFEKTLADTIADKYENSKVMVHIIRNWRDDAEFARQLINGCSPFRIQRLDAIPANFRVTNEMVEDRLGPGRTLEREMQDGRIFLVSFPDLLEPSIICLAEADASRSQRRVKGKLPPRFICAPKVMLYSTRGDQPSIIPLAIQLSETQTPLGGEPLIFTKRDDIGTYSDWMVAKMWVRVAATNTLIIGANISFRLMMEPIALALLRNLPAVHPVHKLLIQHLKDVVAINAIYRQHVLPLDGALAEVLAITKGVHLQYIAKVIAEIKLDSFDGERTFRRLNLLTDDDILPGFWQRDDFLRHWSAIKDFVTDIIGVYYKSDSDVTSDTEFRNFMEDLRHDGGLPSVVVPETIDELIQSVAAVIFTCTTHQAATSRGLLDMLAYCPNSPPCMMKPPPTVRHPRGYTEQEMKDMLPNPDHVERFIGFVMLLFEGYKPAQIPLGSYPERYFTEAPCLVAIDKFRKRLRQVSEDIRLRNANIDCPYEYLLPSNVNQFFTV